MGWLRVTVLVAWITGLGACAHGVRASVSSAPPDGATIQRASVNGRYEGLLGSVDVPEDQAEYGAFYDWGYWAGGDYKGAVGLPAGYWVYVAPTWFIWRGLAAPASLPPSNPEG